MDKCLRIFAVAKTKDELSDSLAMYANLSPDFTKEMSNIPIQAKWHHGNFIDGYYFIMMSFQNEFVVEENIWVVCHKDNPSNTDTQYFMDEILTGNVSRQIDESELISDLFSCSYGFAFKLNMTPNHFDDMLDHLFRSHAIVQ